MSNLEAKTAVLTCQESGADDASVEVLTARDVPLGGIRAMNVRRTLPQRARSLIGAWCFADHYGPDDVAETGGMRVPPHPHTGLQTVSWLFSGEIEHRDSLGTHEMVRPGELNLMTAGHGIAHSEVSTEATKILHGMQLWVALPEGARDTAPAFEHYAPSVKNIAGGRVSVFLGTLAGETSPVRTFSPLLGAEISLDPNATMDLEVDAEFEHGAIVDAGPVEVCGTRIERAELGFLGPGRTTLRLRNLSDDRARLVLLGGAPFGEKIVMWWNFVGRNTDEIAASRRQWQAEIGDGATDERQFGAVPGYEGGPIPAPVLPNLPLKPRG
ncbi:pirin family protein [Skermania sp. ID1734]|uniref:pirin family protein n=1 Tax=Skermania sp. ID1734 TaxID=2597516 RepID=UPI00117D56B6|nr:pirin family protein [Skermania sp. ID1734]TSE00357.1 pirin family protein [Skermania sp. ID1734]